MALAQVIVPAIRHENLFHTDDQPKENRPYCPSTFP